MIASDRVRLDGLIHQWEEIAACLHREGNERESAPETQAYLYGSEHGYSTCANDLRAVLLVLGERRPPQHQEP